MESRMKTVGGEELFEHLAGCVASFMKQVSTYIYTHVAVGIR